MAKAKYETVVAPKLDEIEQWAKKGLTEEQIAHNLGIASSTFRKYKNSNEAMAAALARGKEVPDQEVENALYKKCLGYNAKIVKHYKVKRVEYDEVTGKKILEEEELKAVEDEVHVPADVTAQMFWLSNRRRDRWAYRPEKAEEVEQNDTGIVVLPPVLERPEPGQTETEEGNAG